MNVSRITVVALVVALAGTLLAPNTAMADYRKEVLGWKKTADVLPNASLDDLVHEAWVAHDNPLATPRKNISPERLSSIIRAEIDALKALEWGGESAVIRKHYAYRDVVKKDDDGNVVGVTKEVELDKWGNPVVADVEYIDQPVPGFTRPAWPERNLPERQYTLGEVASMFFYKAFKANRDREIHILGRHGKMLTHRLRREYKLDTRAKGVVGNKMSNRDFVTWVNEAVTIWASPREISKVVNRRTGERQVVKTLPPCSSRVEYALLQADKNFNAGTETFTRLKLRQLKGGGWSVSRRKKGIDDEINTNAVDALGLPTTLWHLISTDRLPAPNLDIDAEQLHKERHDKIRDVVAAAHVIDERFAQALVFVADGFTVSAACDRVNAVNHASEDEKYLRQHFEHHRKQLGIARRDLEPDDAHMTREQMEMAIAELRARRA